MKHSNANTQLITDLVVHLGRLTMAPDPDCSLTAAQWSALGYFAYANRVSRTPSAFAQFHGTTRGTASQTVKSLVNQGLLGRLTHPDDKRSVEFHVTDAGQARLTKSPSMKLFNAIASLPNERQTTLLDTVQALIDDIADHIDDGSMTRFGNCGSCKHYQNHAHDVALDGTCNTFNTTLAHGDEHRMCARYTSNN